MSKDTRIEIIECACGCGQTLNKYDGHYRTKEYINGHNNRKYDDPKEYKKVWWENNKEATKEKRGEGKRKRRTQKRAKLLKLLGGKCTSCGLEVSADNQCVFDLHHVNPENKKFTVNATATQNYAWETVVEEASKCIILCSNCHRLHHHSKKEDTNERIPNKETE